MRYSSFKKLMSMRWIISYKICYPVNYFHFKSIDIVTDENEIIYLLTECLNSLDSPSLPSHNLQLISG